MNGKKVVEKRLKPEHESLPVDLSVDVDTAKNKHLPVIDGNSLQGGDLHLEPAASANDRHHFRRLPPSRSR